jgi:hypothetical protein
VIFGRSTPTTSTGCAILVAHFLPLYFDKLNQLIASPGPGSDRRSVVPQSALSFSSTPSRHSHPNRFPSAAFTTSFSRSHVPASPHTPRLVPNRLHYAVAARNLDEVASLLSTTCLDTSDNLLHGKDLNGWCEPLLSLSLSLLTPLSSQGAIA